MTVAISYVSLFSNSTFKVICDDTAGNSGCAKANNYALANCLVEVMNAVDTCATFLKESCYDALVGETSYSEFYTRIYSCDNNPVDQTTLNCLNNAFKDSCDVIEDWVDFAIFLGIMIGVCVCACLWCAYSSPPSAPATEPGFAPLINEEGVEHMQLQAAH